MRNKFSLKKLAIQAEKTTPYIDMEYTLPEITCIGNPFFINIAKSPESRATDPKRTWLMRMNL